MRNIALHNQLIGLMLIISGKSFIHLLFVCSFVCLPFEDSFVCIWLFFRIYSSNSLEVKIGNELQLCSQRSLSNCEKKQNA